MTHKDQKLGDYLDLVAARTSTPGGGAVAATAAAEACALMSMVARFSEDETSTGIARRIPDTIDLLLELAEQDSEAFKAVMQAYSDGADTSGASIRAAEVPAQIISVCLSQLDDLEHLSAKGNANLITDVAIAALLFDSALKSCELNILVNIRDIESVPATVSDALDALPNAASRLGFITSTVRTGLL